MTIHPDGTVIAVMTMHKGGRGGSCSNPNPEIRGTREVIEFDPPLVIESGDRLGPIGSWTAQTFQFAYGFPGVNLFEGPFTRHTMSGEFSAGGTFEGECGTTVSSQTRTFVDIPRID